MKFIFILLVLAGVGVWATSREDVKRETKEAVDTASQYSVEQKEKVQKNMEENLTKMKKEIADLKAEAERKGSAVSANTKTKIHEMELKQEELQKDLSKLKASSGRAWEEMKKGMNQAMKSLSDSYQKAKAQF